MLTKREELFLLMNIVLDNNDSYLSRLILELNEDIKQEEELKRRHEVSNAIKDVPEEPDQTHQPTSLKRSL